jgi:hypothetical protein
LSHLEELAAAPVFSSCLAFVFPSLLLYVALELASSAVKLEEGIEDPAVVDWKAVVVAGEAIA